MSEAVDPLETELSALSPHGVSPDFRSRVADRLAARPTHNRWIKRIALIGALATAGTLVLLAPWRKDLAPPEIPLIVPAPPAAIESQDDAPALIAYQRALARSPEDLDALFERFAASAPNADSARMPVGIFPRSGAIIDVLLGDN